MLSPYRVLDLTDQGGLQCGQLLAELGADVIQIEPPEGSAARREDPFAPGTPGPEGSLFWRAFARGKRSVVLDLLLPPDRERLLALVDGADFLIESSSPGTMRALGLDYEDLAVRNPGLIYVSITPFGRDGPKARYATTDLIVQAASGAMVLSGDPDRAPLRTAGIRISSFGALEAAGAALVALFERARSGRGQRVDVSTQLAAGLAAGFTLLSAQIGARAARRQGSAPQGPVLPWIWPCKDGFVSLTVGLAGPTHHFTQRLLSWMEEERALSSELRGRDWPATLAGPAPAFEAAAAELGRAIREFLLGKSKAELLEAAVARGLLSVPIATAADVLESPQLRAREFWREHDGLRLPGPFARFSRTPLRERRGAPRLGEHTAEVLREHRAPPSTGAVPTGADHARGGRAARALEGLRILDFAWVMAGPYSTRVLADYGATVVKVESSRRIDLVRVLPPFYGDRPGLENSASFSCINAGKRSVTLDLATEQGRAVALDLVEWADLVLESFSPRAMRAWGLDYAALRERRRDLIMLSTCLSGQSGPHAQLAGYGTMGAALAGLVQPTGWPDRAPCGPFGPYTDWVAPRFTVLALLAALDHRRRTGEGQYIDQSQIESTLHLLAPALLDHQAGGPPLDRVANTDPVLAPHAVLPAAGDDEWIAIAARDDADWRALCEAMERPDLLGDPHFQDADSRRSNAATLELELSAWTKGLPPLEIERCLQARGVPAHAVMHTGLAVDDPQLRARSHFPTAQHAVHGEVRVESVRSELSRTPSQVERAGPTLGQDTEAVLTELLGYSPDRIAGLRAAGALG